MLDITLIPKEVKDLATKFAGITSAIQKDLASNTAIEVAALIPGGATLDVELQALCTDAIKGCNALIAVADSAGVKGRLQRLGTDLTQLEHASKKHTISFYVQCFEAVYNDLFRSATS